MKFSTLFVLFFSLAVNAQVNIAFQPTWNKQSFRPGDTLSDNQGQQIRIDTYRFYLSDFSFYLDTALVYTDTNKAHLFDLEHDSTLLVSFPELQPKSYNSVSFRFGIDSTTNVSGAMAGDLDPMYGMYWSWQSGYINCKLEGKFIGAKSTAFQYHLGGYLPPFSASSSIVLNCGDTNILNIELNKVFHEILDEQNGLNIMSPCSQAVELSEILANSFYFTK